MERSTISTRTRLFVVLLLSILSFLIQETLGRGSLGEALLWGWSAPHLALANYFLVLVIMMLTAALIGRFAPGALAAFLILALFSILNHGKIVRLHQPLFPWDFWYYKQIIAIFPALSMPEIMRSSIEPVSAALFVLFWFLVTREKPLKPKARIALALATSMTLFSVVYHRNLPWDVPSFLATENEVWDQRRNYERNGFLLAFAMNAQPILIDEPEAYCEEAIHELLKDVVSDRYEARLSKADQPISLVLFVSESFYDLMHVAYEADEDPLVHFRELQTRFPSFRMISPTFGGNTSNVEFEMLTGLSNAFLPPSAIPYDHYLKRDTPSIAGILKGSGYATVAIHPYHDWFWNRRNVLPMLGFDEFIALRQFSGAKQRGWFISDEALVDRIIDRIEGMGESPFFVYALSMQNHGEYDPNRYAPDEVAVRAELSEKLLPALRTYVTGLRDADRELARLLGYLESRPEPIVTLFCGDHLPSFGPEYALYRELGAIESESGVHTLEEQARMASVPCLLWANKADLLDRSAVPEHLSPIYFPPLLLRQLGVDLPGHLRYLSQGMGDYPVVHRQFLWERDGELRDFVSALDSDRFLKGLEMLQYDILFGERYSLQEAEGSHPMLIEATPEERISLSAH